MTHRRIALALACATTAGMTLVAGPAEAGTLFKPYVALDQGSWARSTAIGDVTGDGRPDVLATTWYDNNPAADYRLWVYPQAADGSLQQPISLATSGGYTSRMSLVVADLDGDGDQDAGVSTTQGVDIFAQHNGALAKTWTVPIANARDVEAADVSGDGLSDLVVNTDTGVKVWWQINGDFMRSPRGELVATETPKEVEVGDVTGDGRNDLVAAGNASFTVRAGEADGSFGAATTYLSGGTDPWATVNGIAIGDLDGDGTSDVAVAGGGNRPNSWVALHFQEPDGTLGDRMTLPSHDIPETIELADVDGNGRQDIVTLHGGWNAAGIYLANPDGGFYDESLEAIPYASHYDVKGLAIGDFSGDGRHDLALGDYNYGLVLLRGAVPGTDISPPETTITAGPAATHRSRTAQVAFTSTEPGTFQCSLDSAPAGACTSPASLTNLSQGSHTFRVWATDKAGNSDSTPAAATFRVEGPDTTITSGPTGTIRATSASFGFSSSPTAASYECSLDTAAWSPCTTGQTFSGLATGKSYTFLVRGVNSEGLYDSTPASRSFSIDSSTDLAVTTTPSASTVKKGGTVTFTTTVRNLGSYAASGVSLSQGLPTGLTFKSATTGCSVTGATVRCAPASSLAPGATWTVTITATVTATKGTLTSTAVVSTTSWDTNAANDSTSTSVKVGAGK